MASSNPATNPTPGPTNVKQYFGKVLFVEWVVLSISIIILFFCSEQPNWYGFVLVASCYGAYYLTASRPGVRLLCLIFSNLLYIILGALLLVQILS